MARRWIVEGQVQGVGFRWFAQLKARELGLRGWVRNLPDASVEVVASGDDRSLEEMEKALRRGPPAAEVIQLRRLDAPAEADKCNGFDVRR